MGELEEHGFGKCQRVGLHIAWPTLDMRLKAVDVFSVESAKSLFVSFQIAGQNRHEFVNTFLRLLQSEIATRLFLFRLDQFSQSG